MDGENNGKPYQNGWFGGKTHYQYRRKHSYISSLFLWHCSPLTWFSARWPFLIPFYHWQSLLFHYHSGSFFVWNVCSPPSLSIDQISASDLLKVAGLPGWKTNDHFGFSQSTCNPIQFISQVPSANLQNMWAKVSGTILANKLQEIVLERSIRRWVGWLCLKCLNVLFEGSFGGMTKW